MFYITSISWRPLTHLCKFTDNTYMRNLDERDKLDKTTLRIGYVQFFVRTDELTIMHLSFLLEQLVSLPDMGL